MRLLAKTHSHDSLFRLILVMQSKMNCNFAMQNEYLISISRLGQGSLPYLRKWDGKFFGHQAEFEQNK